MKVLHLTLKKKWFDMIVSGEKKEEYREIKPYWMNRLCEFEWRSRNNSSPYKHYTDFKEFDAVTFKNGYAKNAPNVTLKFEGIAYGSGNNKWGAEAGEKYFIIKLGEKILTETK